MVIESDVLFGIKHFQKCRRWIAPKIHTLLSTSSIISQGSRRRSFHRLNNFTGHWTDICTSMAANFCFITHTTKWDTDKFSSKCSCNGFCQRSFSNTGGPTKQNLARISLTRFNTAICSSILSFGLSKPKWSVSSISFTWAIVKLSFVFSAKECNKPVKIITCHSKFGRHGEVSSIYWILPAPYFCVLGIFAERICSLSLQSSVSLRHHQAHLGGFLFVPEWKNFRWDFWILCWTLCLYRVLFLVCLLLYWES